jgi:hypothetical protein
MKIAIIGAQVKQLKGHDNKTQVSLEFVAPDNKAVPQLYEWHTKGQKIDVIIAEGK